MIFNAFYRMEDEKNVWLFIVDYCCWGCLYGYICIVLYLYWGPKVYLTLDKLKFYIYGTRKKNFSIEYQKVIQCDRVNYGKFQIIFNVRFTSYINIKTPREDERCASGGSLAWWFETLSVFNELFNNFVGLWFQIFWSRNLRYLLTNPKSTKHIRRCE